MDVEKRKQLIREQKALYTARIAALREIGRHRTANLLEACAESGLKLNQALLELAQTIQKFDGLSSL